MQAANSIENHHDIRLAGKKGFYSNIIQRMLTDIDYLYLIGKIFKIKVLKQKTPIFAIIDVNNICNLHCKHCYWWLTRDGEKKELTSDDWKKIIREKIKKNHILQTNIVGGEPMLRPDLIEIFNEEVPGKFTIVTNGTYELIPYSGINFQFHTPFQDNDPLWIPYGNKKNKIINQIISLKEKFPNYIIHETKQLELLRAPWGGDEKGPIKCPNWAILVLDHRGDVKTPCCLGSAKSDDVQPQCQSCGMSNYSSLLSKGISL